MEPLAVDYDQIAEQLQLPGASVRATAELLDEGNTVPFITRYRKDQTGGMDEQQIRAIEQAVLKYRQLAERKETILKSIEAQEKLTDELARRIRSASSSKLLEDLYLPFKPKKQTLATAARAKGLEPLCHEVLFSHAEVDLNQRALAFVDSEKGLFTSAEVLTGVGHLVAEHYSERPELRGLARKWMWRGKISSQRISESEEPLDGTAEMVTVPEGTDGDEPGGTSPPLFEQHSEPRGEAPAAGQVVVGPSPEPPGEGEAAGGQGSHPPAVDAPGGRPANPDPAPRPLLAKARETKLLGRGIRARLAEQRREQRREARRRKRQKLEQSFKDYFSFSQTLQNVRHHQVLAINRGERFKVLRVKLEYDQASLRQEAETLVIPAEHANADFLRSCLYDALARLVCPSIEREIRRELTERAEAHAVQVFARNLRKLLLQPPLRNHRVLAIDPGFRSGCKLVALDEFGTVLGHSLIHAIGSEEQRQKTRRQLADVIEKYGISVVAIGNGTGSRETEQLVAEAVQEHFPQRQIRFTIVNEAGASVYSTSAMGREELPEYDASVRGAVSIGRRLIDPLSELVKIDPASIGVGLYQHDVKAKHLRSSLDAVVESCVNYVGVDVNSASPALLGYVSGLNQLTARRVYEYRQKNGPFRSREQLTDVPGIGESTYVQAAGFLKLSDFDNPLDGTWIHPESYDVARTVLAALNIDVAALRQKQPVPHTPAASRTSGPDGDSGTELAPSEPQTHDLASLVAQADAAQLAQQLGVGRLLLEDILAALARPGRDPREDLPGPSFRREVTKLDDLQAGMELTAIVLNVVDFGAFVDIGLNDRGLIHISRLSEEYVVDPHEVVGVGDILTVWVVEVDTKRRRVSLTAIPPGIEKRKPPRPSQQTFATKHDYPRKRPERRQPTDRQSERRKRERQHAYQAKTRQKHVKPITQAMVEGREPMRTFSDLQQYFQWRSQTESPPASSDGSPSEPQASYPSTDDEGGRRKAEG